MAPDLYALALEVSALLTLWVGLSVWQRDLDAPGGRWFLALALAAVVWCFAELLRVRDLAPVVVWVRIKYLGALTAAPFFATVAAYAAALPLVHRVRGLPWLLAAPSAFLYGLLYMGPWSALFVSVASGRPVEGPLFTIQLIYNYALMAIGLALFVRAAWRWPRKRLGWRIVGLMTGVLLPLVGNFLHLYAGLGLDFDPTPALIGLGAIPVRAAIFRGGMLDVMPIDQRRLISELPAGLLLANDVGELVEINRAAERLLGVSREQALGRALPSLLGRVPPDVEVMRSKLRISSVQSLECAVLLERRTRPGSASRAA